jgi:hypothetical protein
MDEKIEEEKNKYTIKSLEQFIEFRTSIYDKGGKPDWSHIIPYYSDDIHFKDIIQEIRGINDFKAMIDEKVKRLKIQNS